MSNNLWGKNCELACGRKPHFVASCMFIPWRVFAIISQFFSPQKPTHGNACGFLFIGGGNGQ